VWAQGVEVVDEGGDDGFGVSQGSEAMKPSTLFLEGANEAFAKAVLLRGIRSCNAPLEVGQPFVLFRLPFCISFDGIQLVICS
jgi:hypothetical protein